MKGTKLHRYPGAQPFKIGERTIFFGRDEDSRKLAEMIRLKQTIVLYGKSGLGKSSLLNAAVIPMLQEPDIAGALPALPIQNRFGSFDRMAGDVASPLESVLYQVNKHGDKNDWTKKFGDNSAKLWLALKSVQHSHPENQIFLILDQFEEFFTYPPFDREHFASQLAQVLHEKVPQSIRLSIERKQVDLTEEERNEAFRPLNLKVLFAIRSDRMSHLDELSHYLPNILRDTFQLKPLTRQQAEEAIIYPAYNREADYESDAFDYDNKTLEEILDFLSGKGTSPIETTQLQIICQQAERKVVDGTFTHNTSTGMPQIHKEDLGDLGEIYGEYYQKVLKEIPPDSLKDARELIEDLLILDEEKRRVPVDEGIVERKVSQEVLDLLVDKHHLLRTELHMGGGLLYELSHDTLVEPILKAKKSRVDKEEAEKAKAEREELEQKLAEEERQKRKPWSLRRKSSAGLVLLTSWCCCLLAPESGLGQLGRMRVRKGTMPTVT